MPNLLRCACEFVDDKPRSLCKYHAQREADNDRLRGQVSRLVALIRSIHGHCNDDRIDAALAVAAVQPSAESCEADVLLTALGLDAERFRTECGFINVPKVLAALKHPDYYRGLYLRTADNGDPAR